jgi:hypothetical protein
MSRSSILVPVIGLGAFVAVIVAAAGGAYWWWQQSGYTLHGLVAEARSAEADGNRFAVGRDEQACVDEAVTRAKGAGMTAALKAQPFLTTCLRAARPVAGFCDGVPAPYDVLKVGAWNRQRSSDYGLSPFEAPFVLQPIQHFCTLPPKATAASGPDCSALRGVNGEWQATRDTTFVIKTANGDATMRLPAGSVLHRNAFHMNGVDPVDVVDRRCRT